ncbi:glucose-1-phosphatase-like [Zerene cesonia]|uniref:glucose-1-phosphatase-like n=1 Tax=Zerene cesonia TaxID=33412 RepID=UPI0018E54168|nr:glucose-1-phosphatase-like [Zerene cesonia]
MAGKLLVSMSFFIFLTASAYDLKQVLILSRHNIRAPLSSNLHNLSNNTWPKWNTQPGFLTAKGALLEGYIGNYISNWLVKKGLLPNGCPDSNDVYIYANTRQRTRETAKAFVNGAFKNCSVTVYSKNSTKMDPVFNPVFRNMSLELKSQIVEEMKQKLDNLRLKKAYSKLNDLVHLEHSPICKKSNVCNFLHAKDSIVYEIGEEPNINGPLAYTNSIVDAFIMSYYEGMPTSDVAWGKIKSSKDWNLLTRVTQENQNVRFNSTVLAKEVAKPLLKYIYDIFKNENSPKFTLLVGHDANLNSVMAAIGFKPYVLPDQYEVTPLGGKLVFQKWHDSKLNKDLLKVDYIYQTVKQLRDGDVLSESNPPRWMKMEIRNCQNDFDGFCQWSDFIEIMKSISY